MRLKLRHIRLFTATFCRRKQGWKGKDNMKRTKKDRNHLWKTKKRTYNFPGCHANVYKGTANKRLFQLFVLTFCFNSLGLNILILVNLILCCFLFLQYQFNYIRKQLFYCTQTRNKLFLYYNLYIQLYIHTYVTYLLILILIININIITKLEASLSWLVRNMLSKTKSTLYS